MVLYSKRLLSLKPSEHCANIEKYYLGSKLDPEGPKLDF
jgi:hypothetical protein